MNRHQSSTPAPGKTGRSHTLVLQHCDHCGEIQYPPREVCKNCLGGDLSPGPVDNCGVLLAGSDLHHSLEPDYRRHLPWKLAAVLLDCGVRVLAHNPGDCTPGARVRVVAEEDDAGNTLLAVTAMATAEHL